LQYVVKLKLGLKMTSAAAADETWKSVKMYV
jgi:hypothetical protein